VFLKDFNSVPSIAATTPHEIIITGDFKIHLDNPTDHFTSVSVSRSSFNLTQHASFPTHDKSHILNLVITSADSSLAPAVSVIHWSPSDHFPVFTKSHARTVVRECCKGDDESKWERGKFDPPPGRHPKTP